MRRAFGNLCTFEGAVPALAQQDRTFVQSPAVSIEPIIKITPEPQKPRCGMRRRLKEPAIAIRKIFECRNRSRIEMTARSDGNIAAHR